MGNESVPALLRRGMIGKETLLRPLCLFSAAVRLDSACETRCIDAARAAILVLVETRIEHDSSNVSNSATAISPLGSVGHNDSFRYAAKRYSIGSDQ